MLTLHPNEEEARRSAEILSQRLRRQTEGAAQIEAEKPTPLQAAE